MLQVDSITSRGLSFASAGESETETLHYAGPHVLDDEIAPLRQAARERDAIGLLEIDGDTVFRVVEEGEAAAAIVSGAIVLERRILDAKAVGPVTRLDMDDGRSEIAQQLADMRTRGIAAEFEDLEIAERLRDGGHDCPLARPRRRRTLAAGADCVSSAVATRARRAFAATETGSAA